jgi:hypothetical protein
VNALGGQQRGDHGKVGEGIDDATHDSDLTSSRVGPAVKVVAQTPPASAVVVLLFLPDA